MIWSIKLKNFTKFEDYFLNEQNLPKIFAKIGGFCGLFGFNLNLLILLAMSCDQYIIIFHTLKSRLEPKKCWKALAPIWSLAFLFSLIMSTNFDVQLFDSLFTSKNTSANLTSLNEQNINSSCIKNSNQTIHKEFKLIKSSILTLLTILISFFLFLILYSHIWLHFYKNKIQMASLNFLLSMKCAQNMSSLNNSNINDSIQNNHPSTSKAKPEILNEIMCEGLKKSRKISIKVFLILFQIR